MARVLLIRPPVVYARTTFSAPATPPLSVAYLAGALRSAGHQPLIIDALGQGLATHTTSYHPDLRARGLTIDDIVNQAQELDHRGSLHLISVSAMFSSEWPHTRALIAALAEALPGVPVAVGGEHATASVEEVLATGHVTFVGRGEGENVIVDMARWADGDLAIDEIDGASYIVAGELLHNQARARITSVDSISRPAWDLVDLEPYFSSHENHGVDRGRTMPLLATRGCPYRCTFCSNPGMWTTRYVMRDVVDVVDEIAHYVTTYAASNIDFYDLTAVVRKDWILRFCEEIRRRELEITWQLPSGTRSEALDEEVIAAMTDAGCRNITYAPESGSRRTLKAIKKKVSLERMCTSVRAAVRAGVSVKCNIILGFPHETRRDLAASALLATKLAWLGVEDVGMFLFSPYPGSELHEQLRRNGCIPVLDDDYYRSLLAYMDIRARSTYCTKIGARELALWRSLGLAAFYAVMYLRRPGRILRTITNIRHERAHSVLETRLQDLRRRKAAGTVSVDRDPFAGVAQRGSRS